MFPYCGEKSDRLAVALLAPRIRDIYFEKVLGRRRTVSKLRVYLPRAKFYYLLLVSCGKKRLAVTRIDPEIGAALTLKVFSLSYVYPEEGPFLPSQKFCYQVFGRGPLRTLSFL